MKVAPMALQIGLNLCYRINETKKTMAHENDGGTISPIQDSIHRPAPVTPEA